MYNNDGHDPNANNNHVEDELPNIEEELPKVEQVVAKPKVTATQFIKDTNWLTMQEMADVFGTSANTMRRELEKSGVTAFTLGKTTKVREQDFEDFVKSKLRRL